MTRVHSQEALPVFPLTGVLLLPGTHLPLNVFEPRYLNLVHDALDGDQVIGMIQPEVPGPDNWGIEAPSGREPRLYPVGCRGRIVQHQVQDEGRYLIVLEGTRRFRVRRELEPVRGYRRVEADCAEFEIDRRREESPIDITAIREILEPYSRRKGFEIEASQLEKLPGGRLVNMLSAALPFSAAEKQALLEAHSPDDRAELLTTLMSIEIDTTVETPPASSPTVN